MISLDFFLTPPRNPLGILFRIPLEIPSGILLGIHAEISFWKISGIPLEFILEIFRDFLLEFQ